jgi:hypothetical protein
MAGMSPEEILQIHKGYADQFTSLTQSGLIAAFSALSNSGLFDYFPAAINIQFPSIGEPNRPSVPAPPEIGGMPEMEQMAEFFPPPTEFDRTGAPGAFSTTAPTYTAPSKPAESPGDFSATAPTVPTVGSVGTPQFITMPSTTLPYTTVDIPDKPPLSNPVFEGVRPDDLILPSAESLVQMYEEERAESRGMLPTFMREQADAMIAKYVPEFNALRAKINDAVASYTGGVGIPSSIEGAIMARNYDRVAKEFNAALDTTLDTIAKRGFTLPPGALQGALTAARMEMGNAAVRGSTEVATKNLELEQQNFQFMLTLGKDLEVKMLDIVTSYLALALKVDEQAIAAAKEIVITYISAYNLQVLVYKALWDGYQADATVLKARIDANDSLVRMYEAEIKAELAKTEVNKSTAEVLMAVANANRAISDAYKAQVEAAQAPLEVAKAQTAVYEAQARAYAAKVQGFAARWDAYKAQVEGELGKFKAYTAQAEAYEAQARAYGTNATAYAAYANGVGEANKAVAVSNEGKIRKYDALANHAIKEYEGKVAGYTAEAAAAVKLGDIEVEYWRTKANLIFQEYNAAMNQTFEYAREQMNLFRAQMEAAIHAANGLAQASNVAGNLAGSAMQGLSSFAGKLVTSEQ